MTHTITLERGRALLHVLERVESPAEREAYAELAVLRTRWKNRAGLARLAVPRHDKRTFLERKAERIAAKGDGDGALHKSGSKP